MKTINLLAACCLTMCLFVACKDGAKKEGRNVESITIVDEDGKKYSSYQEACRAQNFEVAHKFLDAMHEKYLKELGLALDHETMEESHLNSFQIKYFSALEFVYKQEIMFLVAEYGSQAANRIIFLLNEFPLEGHIEKGIINPDEACDVLPDGQARVAYTKFVESFNKVCDCALDLAINQGDKNMTELILKQYKPNVITMVAESPSVKAPDGTLLDEDWGYVYFLSTSQDAAQMKYNEAVKYGAFNN